MKGYKVTELKKLHIKAVTSTICLVMFFVIGENFNVYFRMYIVLFACVPFHFWGKYIRKYIDHKINLSKNQETK